MFDTPWTEDDADTALTEIGVASIDPALPEPAAPAAPATDTANEPDPVRHPAPRAHQRPTLRQIPADEARLWARLGAGRRIPLHLQPGAEPAWCEWLPAEPGTPTRGCRVAWVGPVGTMWIEDGEAFLHALTGIDVAADEAPAEPAAQAAWRDLQQWLAGAATAALAGTGWPGSDRVVLSDTAWSPPDTAVAAGPAGPARPALRRLRLQLRTEDHVLTTHGWAEDATWVDRLHDAAPMPGAVRLDSAAVQAAVVVARHRLTRGALQGLRPGSLIRPAQAWQVDGRGSWQLGASRWQARLTDRGLELDTEDLMDDTAIHTASDMTDATHDPFDGLDAGSLARPESTHDPLHDTPAFPGGAASGPRLDALPITLHFEAGQIRLTVAEAARLAPGSVLGLQDAPGPAQVVIRAGGVALGTGELVEVAGRLAVLILRWTGAGAEIAP